MKPTAKYFLIFSLSVLLGLLGVFQYISVSQKREVFAENNRFRELRIFLESNKAMDETKEQLEKSLLGLSSEESVYANAKAKIESANDFSGIHPLTEPEVSVLAEGQVTIRDMTQICNILWNAGVINMQINGTPLSKENAGFDSAGGQILLGGTPLQSPYLFSLSGNKKSLVQILSPSSGIWKQIQNQNIKIIVSTTE